MKQVVLSVCIWTALFFCVADLLAPNQRQLSHAARKSSQNDMNETAVNTTKNNTITRPNTNNHPQWLSNYIDWHAKQLRLHPAIIRHEVQYLIVDEGVGGLADRLKSLPYYLWLASKHNRVLLIHWDRNCPIDEFFQPNAVNWTNPTNHKILEKAIRLNKQHDKDDYHNNFIDDKIMNTHKTDQVIRVFGNYASVVKGTPIVVAESNNDRHIFRYIFQSLFHLSKPVQQLLDKTKKDLVLSDDYIGVHLRARYPGASKTLNTAGDNVDAKGITNVTSEVKQEILKLSNHAIDCTRKAAGNTSSATQVYFASDTLLAMELQHEKDDRIVYLQTKEERAHFSRVRMPQCDRYYPAIVDLWILSEAKCIGFGAGGYGALATMMSKFDCWTVHQENVMLSGHFKKSTNVFNNNNQNAGELPQCLLPSTDSGKQ